MALGFGPDHKYRVGFDQASSLGTSDGALGFVQYMIPTSFDFW